MADILQKKQVAVCRLCVLGFASTELPKSGSTVTYPFNDLKKMAEILKEHTKALHHTGAYTRAIDWQRYRYLFGLPIFATIFIMSFDSQRDGAYIAQQL